MLLLKRLLLFSVSLFLTLLCCELLLSYIGHTGELTRWNKLERLGERYTRSKDLQWRHKSNLRQHRTCHPDTYHCNTVSTDAFGMRNPTGTLSSATVAFLGDSFLTPDWVERKEAFFSIYADKTNRKIASIASSGWSVEHYVAAAKKLIVPRNNFRHVLVGIYINDWSSYVREKGQKWSLLTDVKERKKKPVWNISNPLLLDYIRSGLGEVLSSKHRCKGGYLPLRNGSFRVLTQVLRPYSSQVKKATLKKLTELKSLLANAPVPKTLSVLFIPTATAVYANQINKLCPVREPLYQRKQELILAETLQEWGKQHGVKVYNPMEVLQKQTVQKHSLYLSHDTHWSPAGHAVVGKWLAKVWKP